MALCIIEGNAGTKTANLGTGTASGTGADRIVTYDASEYPGYENYTVENFRIVSIAWTEGSGAWCPGAGDRRANSPTSTGTMTMSYDNSTGILTISGTHTGSYGGVDQAGNTFQVWSEGTLTPTVELVY